jgi:hypothetical protein
MDERFDLCTVPLPPPNKIERGKWVLHIVGPDDVIEMFDEITALREANKINKMILECNTADPSPHNPFIMAVAKDLTCEKV